MSQLSRVASIYATQGVCEMKWTNKIVKFARRFFPAPAAAEKITLGAINYRTLPIEPAHYQPLGGQQEPIATFTGRRNSWFDRNPSNRWG